MQEEEVVDVTVSEPEFPGGVELDEPLTIPDEDFWAIVDELDPEGACES